MFSSTDRLAPATLYTVNWDPQGEILRWALVLHGVPFINKTRPWHGTDLHLLLTSKSERISGYMNIMLYIFAHSWGTPNAKLFPHESTNKLHDTLASPEFTHACMRIYLSRLLDQQELIAGSLPLPKHQSMYRLFGSVIKIILKIVYDISDKSIDASWTIINKVFQNLEKHVPSGASGRYSVFLNNEGVISLADLELAVYAAIVLFPDAEELDGSFIIPIPQAAQHRKHCKVLRSGPTGRYALDLVRRRNDSSSGSSDSTKRVLVLSEGKRYDRDHGNPIWSEYSILKVNVATGFVFVGSVGVAIFLLHGVIWFALFLVGLMSAGLATTQVDVQGMILQ